jgi:hypothetical protein
MTASGNPATISQPRAMPRLFLCTQSPPYPRCKRQARGLSLPPPGQCWPFRTSAAGRCSGELPRYWVGGRTAWAEGRVEVSSAMTGPPSSWRDYCRAYPTLPDRRACWAKGLTGPCCCLQSHSRAVMTCCSLGAFPWFVPLTLWWVQCNTHSFMLQWRVSGKLANETSAGTSVWPSRLDVHVPFALKASLLAMLPAGL